MGLTDLLDSNQLDEEMKKWAYGLNLGLTFMHQNLKHLKPTVVLFCRHHTKSCFCEAASKQTVGFAW